MGHAVSFYFVIIEKIRSQTKDNTSGFTIMPKNKNDLSRVPIKIFIIHAEKAIFVQNYVISSNSAHIHELTFFGPYRIFISADWHFLALL